MTTKRMSVEEAAAGFFDELLCQDDFDGTWFLVSRADGLEQIEELIQSQRDSAIDECILQIRGVLGDSMFLMDRLSAADAQETMNTFEKIHTALQALKSQKEDKAYG